MKLRTLYSALALLIVVIAVSCGGKESASKADSTGKISDTTAARITFVELGSVSCIPCKKMQPIMKSIEARYAGQVNVVFHDVWKDKAPATKYGIKLIPTQVFLAADGKELMRHEGFFPEEEIDKFLRTQGLSPAN